MLEWLVVKIDELLAISVRIAAALQGLAHETRQQRLLVAETVAATEVVVIESSSVALPQVHPAAQLRVMCHGSHVAGGARDRCAF